MEGFEPTFSTPITVAEFVAQLGYICISTDDWIRTNIFNSITDNCFEDRTGYISIFLSLSLPN